MQRLMGLLVTIAVLGALAIAAPLATASEPQVFSEGEVASVASEAEVDYCYSNHLMCAWQGSEFGGQWSWWNASDTGCHNHANNPKLRSFVNATPYTVRIGGWGNLAPGYGLQMPVNDPITGLLCWPV